MNIIWSKYVQGVKTLYFSRRLRFHDMFAEQYQTLFDLSKETQLKILEIGCGPGALAGSLHRWYPNAEITGLNRESHLLKGMPQNSLIRTIPSMLRSPLQSANISILPHSFRSNFGY